MSRRKQTEELDKLLGQVISVRKTLPLEYELKLKNHLIQRANHMQNGIFDGVKLPTVKRNVIGLPENLQQNQKLTQQSEVTAERYLSAKSANKNSSKELNDVADTLTKFQQIQKLMQNDVY